jgi:hypothetical protein
MSRPVATLVAAAIGGAGLWLAGHWDTATTGGYWAALGVVALAGVLIGLSQLRSPDGNAPGMFLVAFLPIAVTAGWVLVAAQPNPNTYRDHVRVWDRHLGLADVVHYLMPFVPVLAFGIGLVFGLTLLAGTAMVIMRRRTVVEETRPVVAAPVTRTPVVPPPASVPESSYRGYDRDLPTTSTPVHDRYDAEAPTTAAPAVDRYDSEAPTTAEPSVDGNLADEPTAAERAEAEAAEATAAQERAAEDGGTARTSRLNRLLHR